MKRSVLNQFFFFFLLSIMQLGKTMAYSDNKSEVNVIDSLRINLIDPGNNFIREEGSDGEYAEGNYKHHLKDGTWKGVQGSGKNRIHYVEEYENGKLISGVSTDMGGTQYTYTVEEEAPEYPGGMNAVMKFINKNFKIPKEARKRGVNGKIVIQWVVDKEGNVTNASILEDVGYGCGDEGVRVLSNLKKWKPGRQRGKPVSVQFSMPIAIHSGY